ncbi:MAG: hypothetical protein WC729_29290 [Sphingomonas sp.]|jgi:hypothetical protein|uniref:phage head spike fiber domain-containing protein n=1 Tax=Sphingomonas sp. TaxID=28214 RepID=UPI0035662C50
MIRKMLSSFFIAVGLAALLLGSFGALAGVGHQNWGGQQTASAIGSPVVASFPSESFGGALADAANADANTVMYCRMDNPDGTTSTPQCGLNDIKHQGVGPAAVSNLLNVPANSALDFAGDFHECFVASVVGSSGVQRLLTVGNGSGAGYSVGIDANELPVLTTYGAGPSTTVTTGPAAAVIGATNLFCVGRSGTTQWLKLNNGAVQTTVNAKVVAATGVVGTLLNDSATAPWLGRVYEFAASTTAPTEATLDALWTSVATCRTAGRCLPTNASEVAYFNGDSYLVGGSWAGTGLTATLTGQVLTAKSRYNWGAPRVTNVVLQSNVLANASWTKDANVTVADASASCPVDPQGAAMSLVTIFSGGTGVKQDVAATPARSVYLAKQTGNPDCTVDWSDYSGDGSATVSLVGAPARFTNYTAGQTGIKVIANTCPSWCQSSAQLEATTSVGQYCGPTTTAAVTCAGGGLAWTHNGTVPRVTQSNLYPEGFGAKHAGLNGWSAANYLSLGAGPDVLDFTGDGTICVIFNPPANNAQYFIANGGTNKGGYALQTSCYDSCPGPVKALFNDYPASGAVQIFATANTTTAGVDTVICGGRSGTDVNLKMNDGAVANGALNHAAAVGTTVTALVGRNTSGTVLSDGTFKEIFFTSTPATTAYLTTLNNQALSCTKPGRCFTPDANTVMHCHSPDGGGKWLCPINTGADQWTENGTLTKTTPARYVWPAGVDKRDAEAAGPFSDANYFSLGTGLDVLDFAGDFSRCTVINVTSCATAPIIDIDGAAGAGGYYVALNTSCVPIFTTADAAGQLTQTAGSAVALSGDSILCYGRASGAGFISVNGDAAVTSAARTTRDTANPARVGVLNDGTLALAGTVLEQWASSTPASDALFTKIQRRWLDQQGSQAQPVSITRTTEATAVIDGKLYRHPAGTLRSTSQGKLYEGAVINVAQYSEQLNTGWSLYNTSAVTADQSVGPEGLTNMDSFTHTATDGTVYRIPGGLAAGTYTASSWGVAAAGTAIGTIQVFEDTLVTSCTCGTSDGSACTAAIRDARCEAYSTFTTTPKRLWATGAMGTGANVGIGLHAGQITVSNADVRFGYAQFEVGTFPHQYCGPTLNATRTCNADAVTIANPLRPPGNDWTNRILQSENLTVTWAPGGAAISATANTCLAPDGSYTGSTVTGTGANSSDSMYQVLTLVGTDFAQSLWFSALSGTTDATVAFMCFDAGLTQQTISSCTCSRADGSACTATYDTGGGAKICRVKSNFSTAGDRLTAKVQCAAPTAKLNYIITPGEYRVTTAGSVCAWGMQLESGTQVASPYCPTTTAAATCGPGGATGKVITNLTLQSQDLTAAPWANYDGTTTVNSGCPAGLTKVTTAATVGSTAQSVTVASSTGPFVISAEIASPTGAGTTSQTLTASCENPDVVVGSVECWRSDGGACTPGIGTGSYADRPYAVVSVTETPVRVSLKYNCQSATTVFWNGAHGGIYDSTFGAGCFGKYQSGQATVAGPYCGPTGAASKTCAPSQKWCVRAKDVTPENGKLWAGGNAGLLLGGASTVAANSLYSRMSGNNLEFAIIDGAAVSKLYSINKSALVSGTFYTFKLCSNDGVMTMYQDDVLLAPSLTGAGTGLLSAWPSTLSLAASASGQEWNGYIGSIDFNTSGDYRDFGP